MTSRQHIKILIHIQNIKRTVLSTPIFNHKLYSRRIFRNLQDSSAPLEIQNSILTKIFSFDTIFAKTTYIEFHKNYELVARFGVAAAENGPLKVEPPTLSASLRSAAAACPLHAFFQWGLLDDTHARFRFRIFDIQ